MDASGGGFVDICYFYQMQTSQDLTPIRCKTPPEYHRLASDRLVGPKCVPTYIDRKLADVGHDISELHPFGYSESEPNQCGVGTMHTVLTEGQEVRQRAPGNAGNLLACLPNSVEGLLCATHSLGFAHTHATAQS